MVAVLNNMEARAASSIETFLEEFKYYFSRDEEKFVSALTNLLTLASNSEEKLKIIATELDVKILFEAFESEDVQSNKHHNKIILGDVCKLLALILSRHDPLDIISKYGTSIVKSLNSGIEEFHSVCLNQVLRLAESPGQFSMFMSNPEIINFPIKSLQDKSLSIASVSRKIINQLFNNEENTDWLFSNEIYKSCVDLMEKNATIRFRMYEIFMDFLQKYPEYLFKFEDLNTFDKLLADLFDTNDVLSQLNALELVAQVALTGQQGLEFIEKKNIMNWLQTVIESDDPLTQFLLPGAIKCFGVLSANNPARIIPKYQNLVNVIFENLQNEDPSIRCLCVETLGYVNSKTDALKLLYSNPDVLKQSAQTIGRLVASPGESEATKSKILESLSMMFSHDPTDVETSMICEKLFHYISNEPVRFLMDFMQQPFFGMRYGAFKIFRSVSVFSWVEQDMALCAGFLEYLLDRRTETDKEGRELKYDIIKNLSLSNTAKENLGIGHHEKIIQYAKQGPFYSESEVAVTYASS